MDRGPRLPREFVIYESIVISLPQVIERFKKNETNVIVTTNVLEEGIDLQMCNTVIKYDHPQTFASYQQSKGRARMKDSQYMVMLNNEERQKFLEKYRLYKSIEQELQRVNILFSISLTLVY